MIDGKKAFSGFSVNDMAAAKEFYGTILGLDVQEDEMGLALNIGAGNPVFIYAKDNHEPASFTILNSRLMILTRRWTNWLQKV